MSELLPYTTKELLQRIAAGEELAFNHLYRRYSATIFNAAMVYLKDTNTAQDMVQTVFIKLWNNRAALAEIENPENYLFILTRNLVFDHFKKLATDKKLQAKAKASHLFPGHIDDAAYRVEGQEYDKLLDSAIAKLPPRQRQVYLLYHDSGLSYEEIADKLQLSKLTIKKHLELARYSLRNYVNMGYFNSGIGLFFLVNAFLLLQ